MARVQELVTSERTTSVRSPTRTLDQRMSIRVSGTPERGSRFQSQSQTSNVTGSFGRLMTSSNTRTETIVPTTTTTTTTSRYARPDPVQTTSITEIVNAPISRTRVEIRVPHSPSIATVAVEDHAQGLWYASMLQNREQRAANFQERVRTQGYEYMNPYSQTGNRSDKYDEELAHRDQFQLSEEYRPREVPFTPVKPIRDVDSALGSTADSRVFQTTTVYETNTRSFMEN